MRSIGAIALERELQVGDVILSPSRNNIYTVMGELPGIPEDGVSRILMIHTSLHGKIYRHEVPRGRDPNYPFILGGTYTGWGWDEGVNSDPSP
jgi:hypothetical protein